MIPLLAVLSLAGSAAAAKVAGGVVTSQEWVVRRSPVMEEEFKGSVRYRAGPNLVESDWALYEHAKERWTVRGKVRLQRRLESRDVVEAAGEEGWFLSKAQRGELGGRQGVRLKRTPAEGGPPDLARAERAFFEGPQRVRLERAVRLQGPRLEAEADRADYDLRAELLDLSGGRPALRKHAGWAGPEDDWTGALVGERALASRPEKSLRASGAVRGWLQFPREEKRR